MEPLAITAEIVARIEELLTQKGMNRADLSRATGIKAPHITRLMQAEQSTSLETLGKVATALGVHPRELMGKPAPTAPGKKVRGKPADELKRLGAKPLPDDLDLHLPVMGAVPCGPGTELLDYNPAQYIDVQAKYIRGKNLFGLEAKGDSMTGDGIKEGDLLVIEPRERAQNGQTVVALVDGTATLKILQVRGEGRYAEYWLLPANNKMKAIHLDPSDDNRIIGVLKSVVRRV